MKRRWTALLFTAVLLASCRSDAPPVQRAVYHWESAYSLTREETDWMDHLQIRRIYLRIFDIDWDESRGEPVPVGILDPSGAPDSLALEITPSFFLTNRTFQQLTEVQSDTLAARLLRKARRLLDELPGKPLVREWQLDCDWTESTREAYFRFLKKIGQALAEDHIGLSATIRLHQVKYFERTGVPPVDRGMLMFYNMGDVTNPEVENSILDLRIARTYYENFEAYPLPLDLALPLFRWGVVLREGKMVRIINGLDEEGLRDSARFVFQDPTHVEVRKSTYLDGYYLYEADEIRLESVSGSLLHDAALDLSKVLARPPGWVSFYQLAPETIKHYSHEELETICKTLEN